MRYDTFLLPEECRFWSHFFCYPVNLTGDGTVRNRHLCEDAQLVQILMFDIFYYSLIHWLYHWCHVGGKIYNLNIAHEWNFFMNSAIVNQLIVIKAFLFALNSIGFDFLVLKHLSLADLPIISKGNFSVPSILAPTNKVTCSLLFFPPLYSSPLNV